MLAENLILLRNMKGMSQEQIADCLLYTSEEIPIMLPKQIFRIIFANWFWIWVLHRLRSTLQNSRNIIVRKITMSGKC